MSETVGNLEARLLACLPCEPAGYAPARVLASAAAVADAADAAVTARQVGRKLDGLRRAGFVERHLRAGRHPTAHRRTGGWRLAPAGSELLGYTCAGDPVLSPRELRALDTLAAGGRWGVPVDDLDDPGVLPQLALRGLARPAARTALTVFGRELRDRADRRPLLLLDTALLGDPEAAGGLARAITGHAAAWVGAETPRALRATEQRLGLPALPRVFVEAHPDTPGGHRQAIAWYTGHVTGMVRRGAAASRRPQPAQ